MNEVQGLEIFLYILLHQRHLRTSKEEKRHLQEVFQYQFDLFEIKFLGYWIDANGNSLKELNLFTQSRFRKQIILNLAEII